jgi:Transglutaminase-like superfamily
VIPPWTFGCVNPAAFTLLVEAYILLARIRVALWLLPWHDVKARVVAPAVAPSTRFTVDRIERAIRIASRVVPRATCLTQALALSHLLSSSGYRSVVQIGVTNEHGRFTAHAWVECDGATLLSSDADVRRYSRLLTWPPAHPDPVR